MNNQDVNIKDLLNMSLGNYWAYVNNNRAIEDFSDGMKPVWRMIVYAMSQLWMTPNGKNLKSARVEWDVMGKYHPHWSCYWTIVWLAQPFTMRYPLIQGQGNFGSISWEWAAASRYTEIRPSKYFPLLVDDLSKMPDHYFIDNYDWNFKVPKYLPSKIPFMLLNGTTGIWFWLQTTTIPFNLTEVVTTLIKKIQDNNHDISTTLLWPDFPLGWNAIFSTDQWKEILYNGKGKITFVSDIEVIEKDWKKVIVIKNIPPNTDTTKIEEKINDAFEKKKIKEVTKYQNHTNNNMELDMWLYLKEWTNPQNVIKKLYKYCWLKANVSSRYIVLDRGKNPQEMSIEAIINNFIEFRKEIVKYVLEYDLKGLQKDQLQLEAKLFALQNLKQIIDIIYQSENDEVALTELEQKLGISREHGNIIIELKLKSMRNANKDQLDQNLSDVNTNINVIKGKLQDDSLLIQHIVDEWNSILTKFGDARRTKVDNKNIGDLTINEDDLHQDFPIKIYLTQRWYLKKEDEPEVVVQNRWWKWKKLDIKLLWWDTVKKVINTFNKDTIGIITESWRAYYIKWYQIPNDNKWMPLSSIIEKSIDERIVDIFESNVILWAESVVVLYKNWNGMKVNWSKLLCRNWSKLFKWEVVSIEPVWIKQYLMVWKNNWNTNRIALSKIRQLNRVWKWVKIISLKDWWNVISSELVIWDENVLIISKNWLGKITKVNLFRETNRWSKWVKAWIKEWDELIFLSTINDDHLINLMTETNSIYLKPNKVKVVTGRTSKWSKLINTKTSQIINVSLINKSEILWDKDDIDEIINDSNDNVVELINE